MAVPKRRKSRSRSRTARAHQAMTPVQVVYCSKCGSATLPHRVCAECGFYQGREVIKTEEN